MKLPSNQADHLTGVRHDGTNWQYGHNGGWVNFTPVSTDRLLATIDFGTSNGSMDSVTPIGTLGVHAEGIDQGFTGGDLTFVANYWAGWPNGGEVSFTGSTFSIAPSASQIVKKGVTEFGYDAANKRVWKKNTVTPDTINVGSVGAGLALEDNTAGLAYVMYTVASAQSRFPLVAGTQAVHMAGVRHDGTNWQYGHNSGWANFTPVSTDRLLATIDYGTSNGSISSVTAITTLGVHAQGIKQGFTEGNLSFVANQWAGLANGGEVGLAGTWFRPTEVSHAVYIYAGPNCIAEYDAGTAASSPEQEYVYAAQVDSLVMLARGSQKLTVTRNQQWSVTALVDSSDGTVVERYAYDIFGKRTILAADGSTVRFGSSYNNPYGYTSRRHDEETGLMYFRARYYDPTTGEFIAQDPLGYVDGMSLYRGYMGHNWVDPQGATLMWPQDEEDETANKIIEILKKSKVNQLRYHSDSDEHAGFDCDDFAHCGHNVLSEALGDDAEVWMAAIYWKNCGFDLANWKQYPSVGHGMIYIKIDGKRYLVDPQTLVIVKCRYNQEERCGAEILKKGRIRGYSEIDSCRFKFVKFRSPELYYEESPDPGPSTRTVSMWIQIFEGYKVLGIEQCPQTGWSVEETLEWLDRFDEDGMLK